MSVRWQSALLVAALCAAFAGDPSTNIARAQCSRGGGLNSGMSPGLIAQQLMQQQQLSMQLQLLQQVQQQQLQLQTAKLDRQMRELTDKGPEAIKTTLQDPNPKMRLIAVLTIGKYGPALTDELIERLTDDNASVRQAARRALVGLSTARNSKASKGRRVDFGPAANANRSAQQTAARKWRAWFDRQQQREDDLKGVAAARPATTRP